MHKCLAFSLWRTSLALICPTTEILQNKSCLGFSCRLIFQREMDIGQNHLSVISLERGDVKLSIDGLNNNIPYMVQELLKILKLALSWQSQDFKMALTVEARKLQ